MSELAKGPTCKHEIGWRGQLRVGSSVLRRNASAVVSIGAALGVCSLASWGFYQVAQPGPIEGTQVVAHSALVQHGSAWEEQVTVSVPNNTDTKQTVAVGINRTVGYTTPRHTFHFAQFGKEYPVNRWTDPAHFEKKGTLVVGATLISAAGAQKVGDTAVAAIKPGQTARITLDYLVPQSASQRAAIVPRWKGTLFYNETAPVSATATVTDGGIQVTTPAWTELDSQG